MCFFIVRPLEELHMILLLTDFLITEINYRLVE